MTTPVPPTRFALGLVAATTALVLMTGCDRRPTDVPPPTTTTTTPTTPIPSASPASAITPSSSDAPLAPPGTPGPAAPTEGAPSGGATGK